MIHGGLVDVDVEVDGSYTVTHQGLTVLTLVTVLPVCVDTLVLVLDLVLVFVHVERVDTVI